MTKSLRAAATILLSVFALTAWASDTPVAVKKYQAVYVSKVSIEADMDRNSPDEVKYYADLENEATTKITKWFKDEGFTISDAPDVENEHLLIINTKAKFNAGNRALRWVGGIGGAGKATADVTMDAVDPKSGNLISSKSATDSLRMGGFGGSAPGMLMGAIDSAWNYVLSDLSALK